MTPPTSRWAWAYGHLEVTNIVVAPPIEDVMALLPPAFTLRPQTMTPAGTHPVIFMFGQHSMVRPWFRPPGSGGHYNEWIVATPFLDWHSNGAVKPCSYMSRLYLNSLWYVFLGWLYAYPKKLSRSTVTPTSYDVRTFPGNAPRVSMTNAPAGPPVPFSQFPGAAEIAQCYVDPFIQKFWCTPWLGSRMWFELGTSTAQPINAKFSMTAGCAPGLKAMSGQVGPITAGVPGAFHLSVDWMLSRMFLADHMPPQILTPNPPDVTLPPV